MVKNTVVVSAFPGTGKSYLFKNMPDQVILDSDSSQFSWVGSGADKKRNPAFPANYIKHIQDNIGKADLILVSSHEEVRDALDKAGVQYTLFYPNKSLKKEYLKRYKERGSDEAFINLLDKNWDNWIDELEKKTGIQRVVLNKGEYLSDYITEKED